MVEVKIDNGKKVSYAEQIKQKLQTAFNYTLNGKTMQFSYNSKD